ncbi:hypothetical protein [Nocardioides marmoribigeumensis]|uniref:Autophagy-related protein 2 n=1 Tax=Nocardioides marmoribigeumensis TaxID=433649 RepID=A0ABU2BPE1_9ACTN|nr:hypothetical protein [Nocardioides marmoribigeumensis]MDR7360492.1 hypothetical protein [Nocardioides marmoribigeumensis]
MSDEKKDKPETTEDLKDFLNNDPEDLPEAQVDDIPTAPGGADADVNESDVGRGEADDLVTRDQPLSAQTDEDQVPDEIQKPGADADKHDDTAEDEEPQEDEGTEAPD